LVTQGFYGSCVKDLLIFFNGQMNRKLANNSFSGTGWGCNQHTFTFRKRMAGLLLKRVKCEIQQF
jgi:hypothetical protein